MALETPKWLREALRWRWTPTIALFAGSLLYVVVAVLAVPSKIDFSGKGNEAESATESDRQAVNTRGDAPGTSEAANEGEAPADPTPVRRSRRRRIVDPEISPPPAESPPPEAAPAPTETPPAGAIVQPFDPSSVPPPSDTPPAQ